MTFGTVLGTVSNTAVAITNTVGMVNTAVSIASGYVDVLAQKQVKDNIAELSNYEQKLIERLSQEDTERQLAMLEFTSKSTAHAEMFSANMERYKELFVAKK
jgi:hypothetical protein